MSWASSEVVSVLVFLLPGFVAAAVFYSLTSYPKPNEFGQVIQALVFTMVGQSISWTLQPDFGTQAFHGQSNLKQPFLFFLRLFSRSSSSISPTMTLPTDFSGASVSLERIHILPNGIRLLLRNPDSYVVLHLRDGRRLYGWPREWPSHPNKGHIRITEAR